uniref:Uncharacterized protein n=1 Tax=Ciona savignyi TaxID=51511 RepID=H2Z2B7_CIOSA
SSSSIARELERFFLVLKRFVNATLLKGSLYWRNIIVTQTKLPSISSNLRWPTKYVTLSFVYSPTLPLLEGLTDNFLVS